MKVLISQGPGDVYIVEGHAETRQPIPEFQALGAHPVKVTIIDNYVHLTKAHDGNKSARAAFNTAIHLAKQTVDYVPYCAHDTGSGCTFGCRPSVDFIAQMKLKRFIVKTFRRQMGLPFPKQQKEKRK